MFLCKHSCCRPEASAEGSPPWGRRPARSEGCLAIARQDKVGGTFLNSLPATLIKRDLTKAIELLRCLDQVVYGCVFALSSALFSALLALCVP
jgi:hypothetical protein